MRISTRIAAAVLAATVGLTPVVGSAQPIFKPGGGTPFAAPGPGPGPGMRHGPPRYSPGGPGPRFGPGPGYHGRGPIGPGPGYHRPPRHYYYSGGRRYYRDDGWDPGAAAAAGIIGLAVGAMAAGAASSSGDAHVDRCLRRYRSYDPETDTFRGNDGRLHRCRL